MRIFCTIVTAIIIHILFFQTHVQSQEAEKPFPYESWKYLYESKCSKCHSLDRIFTDPKTEGEWRNCITRMIQKSPLWITPEEGEQIVAEILGTRKDVGSFPMKKKYEEARLLFIDRCTMCHSVNRILLTDKTEEEWKETVTRMRDNAPDLFLDEDLPVIIEFLAERGMIMREDVAAQKIVERCLICHDAGRIFLERKSRSGWEETVADMRLLARQDLNKSWFTPGEFKIVVDLLVKTQGLEPEKGIEAEKKAGDK